MKKMFYLLIILCLFSCQKKQCNEFVFIKSYIYDTKHIPKGHHVYNLRVYMKFYYNDSIYDFNMIAKQKERSFTARYNVGDTILLKYCIENPKNSTIIKTIYKK